MSKINRDSLGYLGLDFQVRLLAQIITDRKFASSILDIVDPNYFEDPFLRVIAVTIKDAFEKDEVVPDMNSLEFRLFENVKDEINKTFLVQQLRQVKEANLNDTIYVQDIAMKFCKQQELKKSVREIQEIIEKGNLEDYSKCEEILKKALEHGNSKDDGISVFDNIDSVLEDDFRKPIPTGIKGLDEIMDGGLSKGELAIILAPFGVGKTTMVTKIANSAKNNGYNVLQIFFEDMPKVIQRKHLACWSGYELNDLKLHKDELKEIVETKENEKGILKLKKFSSDGTTIPMIKQYIRKQIAQGFKPDIILLDYIDCVASSKSYDDANVAEGNVMRQFEAMLAELDIAGWTAIQGNRSSIRADVVEADQMAGSIKKGMIGHFIVSIAKTLDQKESGTATMAILKSRFGKDGVIFSDIVFDNARIQIEMTDTLGKTFLGANKDKEVSNQIKVNQLMDVFKSRKEAMNGTSEVTTDEEEIKK